MQSENMESFVHKLGFKMVTAEHQPERACHPSSCEGQPLSRANLSPAAELPGVQAQ